jgi:Tol biopolymer transport system component
VDQAFEEEAMRKLAIVVSSLGSLGSAWAQVTERVSVDSSGAQADFGADLPSPGAVLSADGRYVAFYSGATNLVTGDTNGTWDVFVRDRLSGTTERVSVDSSGAQANGFSGLYGIAISPDGRYVVFESRASNLVTGDTNGVRDIFLRDRLSGTTERVSVDSSGAQGNADSLHPSISPDGRYVSFDGDATNLVPGDTNAQPDVFVRDRVSGTTECVSVSTSGAQGNGVSGASSISADGRYVAFESGATNLGPLDTNGDDDVFIRDRQIGLTTRVSRSSTGGQGNGHSSLPCISADGHYVAFTSQATNLVAGDTNASDDVFVNDRHTGVTERVSVGAGGVQGNGHSTEPSLSADGRYVAFKTVATNLIPSGTSIFYPRILVRDLLNGTNELVSLATDGSIPSSGGCSGAWISAGGRYVAFRSNATDLVPGDTNGYVDIFLHDRFAAGFVSLCDPGIDNLIACPCGNPPSGAGRGCDNSSLTGGATLTASGIAYLSIDSLVFTTSDERPSATSILLQGDSMLPAGLDFGQGVRCVGGTLRRLYVKIAVNGSITAPAFNAGDPTLSSRSAFLGDPIQSGESRFYLVYYRDPIVLGGCPVTSTFNSTQTGSISWWP